MTLELKRTIVGGKINDFINVVDYIYKRDPNYVRPLDMDMRDRLSFKNPFFEHGDGVIFYGLPQRILRRSLHRTNRP